jgi:AraC family transcriptional activator of pobA
MTSAAAPPPDRVLRFPAETGPGPAIHVIRTEKDEACLVTFVHTHEFFAVIFLERAQGLHRTADDIHDAGAGDLYVIAPGEVHDASKLHDAAGWTVWFMRDALGPLAAQDEAPPLPGQPRWLALIRQACLMGSRYVVPQDDRLQWQERFASLARELDARDAGYAAAARSLLTLLLIDTSRLAFYGLESMPERLNPVIEDTFSLIDGRFAEPLTMDDIASEVGRSPGHLTRLVRELTGQTVMHWIQERRMTEARGLLIGTDIKVDAIAARVGYSDAGYFRRRFKRLHGLTPQAWRDTNR